MRRIPTWLTLTLAASYGMLVIPLGIWLWGLAIESLPSEELRILRLIHRQILADYVDERDPETLMRVAIAGMVRDGCDDYSMFVSAPHVDHFEATELEGTYEGIGVLLVPDVAPITIQAPLNGGPAERAGLGVGDRILAVDGVDLSRITPEDATRAAREHLIGPAGSAVTLEVSGPDGAIREVDLKRGDVVRPTVRWAHLVAPEAGIAYVHVHGFQRHVLEEFDVALDWLVGRSDASLHGLILDLRGNPGGLLDAAIGMVDRFLADGVIVSLRRRDDELVEEHRATADGTRFPELPIAILVDGGTASASEVVTGALQDHGRAVVVGERTFGKGVVQSVYRWADEDFRLKITTSRYYTPLGRSIEGRFRRSGDGDVPGGIAPDVPVPIDAATRERVERRLAADEVPFRHLDAARALAAELGRPLAGPPDPADDPALAAAIEALRDR